jgi:hypothetical protein
VIHFYVNGEELNRARPRHGRSFPRFAARLTPARGVGENGESESEEENELIEIELRKIEIFQRHCLALLPVPAFLRIRRSLAHNRDRVC